MMEKKDIVLFGYGNFGKQLYKNLANLGHNIKVVSTEQQFVENGIADKVDITKISIKKNEDILSLGIDEHNDLLYCAMNQTANNLFLVLTLRALFPHANIIAISNSSENTRKLKYAGANSIIDLYESTSRRVVNILTKPAVTKALDEIIYKQNNLKIAEIELPQESIYNGQLVSEIMFKAMGIILIAIIDKELGNELLFIDHRLDHKLDSGDVLVVVGLSENITRFRQRVLFVE